MKSFAKEAVLQPFVERNALKIISGLHNFDKELVENVAWAAYKGGATHIDIACDPELVKIAKSVSNLPVCVSAVEPENFVHAVKAGADMVEIGNFDGFYEKGIEFTADDVIRMTEETRKLLPFVPLSVTIPHTLSLPDQIELAQRIEAAGADIIQTEGKVSANLPAGSVGTQELIGIAAPTLAAAHALSRAVSIPVMCASGLTDVTAPLAAAVGASGVGIGSMVNKLPSRQQMLLAVSALAGSMGLTNTNEGTEAIITLFEDEEESLARKTPSSFSAFKSRDFTNW
eukprot:CAMPEP_0174972146 /NCGR_PEP_ID=MMETSP0004_2-20121128/10459_1 /TAXON_ID=420556 /ORGANISM="Ochromonas sp., Strain CCMP1393" /LENGTH=285 /DNA_ID=CAMNT_0016222321 /DNA_START=96 /DNA_END=953 /DNA_ORIENTATION=-